QTHDGLGQRLPIGEFAGADDPLVVLAPAIGGTGARPRACSPKAGRDPDGVLDAWDFGGGSLARFPAVVVIRRVVAELAPIVSTPTEDFATAHSARVVEPARHVARIGDAQHLDGFWAARPDSRAALHVARERHAALP